MPKKAEKSNENTTEAPMSATARTKGEKKSTVKEEAESLPLTNTEKANLAKLEQTIKESTAGESKGFIDKAVAFHAIQADKLYRDVFGSFEAYSVTKWQIKRAHAYRIAEAGKIIERVKVSPHGDAVGLLTSESHFRPIVKLTDAEQDSVFELLKKWGTWDGCEVISPKAVEAAVLVVKPPLTPDTDTAKEKKNDRIERFVRDFKLEAP